MTAHPIGYIEVQASYNDAFDGYEVTRLIEQTKEKMHCEQPELVYMGARCEAMHDGAGKPRCNLYMGFAPRQPEGVAPAEPLNPHNLNDAPVNNIGDPARDNLIGAKEQKF